MADWNQNQCNIAIILILFWFDNPSFIIGEDVMIIVYHVTSFQKNINKVGP